MLINCPFKNNFYSAKNTDIFIGAAPYNPGWEASGPAIDMVELREDTSSTSTSSRPSTGRGSANLETIILIEEGRALAIGSLDHWKNCTMDSDCHSGDCFIDADAQDYSAFW